MTVKEKAIEAYEEKIKQDLQKQEELENLRFLELKTIFPELEKTADRNGFYKLDDLLFYISGSSNTILDKNFYLRPLYNGTYTYIRDYADLGRHIISLQAKKEKEELEKSTSKSTSQTKPKSWFYSWFVWGRADRDGR